MDIIEQIKAEIDNIVEMAEERWDNEQVTGVKKFRDLLDTKIASLQQEQTDAYDAAMLEVKKCVDKLYDDASIGLNEYDSGLYNGITETCMKLRGFIKARTSKEQSEVDLEKAARYVYESWMGGTMDDVRRDMAELGKVLKARKED